MPSFCRFYFESKFAYNLSEENVIRMLESMKCHFPQSTLNKYIHQDYGLPQGAVGIRFSSHS